MSFAVPFLKHVLEYEKTPDALLGENIQRDLENVPFHLLGRKRRAPEDEDQQKFEIL